MENLYIEGYQDSFYVPTVDFNADTGVCTLEGKSYLEDTSLFYLRLLEWLKQYFEQEKKPIQFNIKLSYYNTSSSRSMLDMLDLLKMYEEDGGEVEVNWYCREIDYDVTEEEVEDYREESELEINIIKLSE